MKRFLAAALGLGAAFAAGALFADDASVDTVKQKIAKTLGTTVEQIHPSVVAGWFEVQKGHDFGYVSSDGKYLLQGDLVNMDTGERITENRRRADRLLALKSLGNDSTVDFMPQPPVAAKYVVTVFTDLDCPYCRKLHSQIADYNARGIAFRYAFFPRHGLNSPTYFQAISVWCSANRQEALTRAKMGLQIPTRKCDNPVDKELKMAIDLGINGTPGLILPDGTLYDGYLPPAEMEAMLAKNEAQATAAAAPEKKS